MYGAGGKRKQHHPRCDLEAASHLFLPHFDRHLLPAAVQHGGHHCGGAVCGHQRPGGGGHHRHPHQPAGGLLCGGVLRRHGDYLPILRRGGRQKRLQGGAHLHCLGLGGRACHHGAGAADGPALFGAAGRARGDTGRRLDLHERVLLRHHRQHDIQRGHRRAAGHWRQPHAPVRAHCLLPGEHCAGPALCAGLPLGRVRRGHCHGALPGGQRGAYHGAADAHPGELPGGAQTHPL
ncbi:unknown [Firmicutes bacterium CAG:94]|nr:unknown [Firmicutes bacterium CAG:94]